MTTTPCSSSAVSQMYENAGMLRYPSSARALAWLYWLGREESERERLHSTLSQAACERPWETVVPSVDWVER